MNITDPESNEVLQRPQRFADQFISGLSTVYTDKLLARIERDVEIIRAFPEIGSPLARESLVKAFGEGIRMFPVSSFVIVYRYSRDDDTVDYLALIHGKTIR